MFQMKLHTPDSHTGPVFLVVFRCFLVLDVFLVVFD